MDVHPGDLGTNLQSEPLPVEVELSAALIIQLSDRSFGRVRRGAQPMRGSDA